MRILLNRAPYMCPVLEDHRGVKNGHYIFNENWIGNVIHFEKEQETETMYIGKIRTKYENEYGWMRVEILKECFDPAPRFEVEPDYELDKGCRCLSCWEPTGKWRVRDMDDEYEDTIFNTEEEAKNHADAMQTLEKARQNILKIGEENKKLREELGLDE